MATTFKDRLLAVVGDRKSPDGQTNRLNSGTTGRINQGHTPGPDILSHICKIENLSLAWLVDGVGEPYLVHRHASDQETAEYIDALLEEDGWSMLLFTDRAAARLVMTLPAEYEYKGKMVPYTAIEILGGPCGHQVLERFNRFDGEKWLIKIGDSELETLHRGRMGNPEILDFLRNGHRIKDHIDLKEVTPRGVSEPPPNYADDIQKLLAGYRKLSPHHRESVLMIIDTLLEDQEAAQA